MIITNIVQEKSFTVKLEEERKLNHFISASQLTVSRIEKLCTIADSIRENPKEYQQKLNGKVIATIFFEPSTRTRLSFEAAIQRLGAGLISTENANESSSGKKGESLQDTTRIIQSYADAIVMRHSDENSSIDAATVATVPVINAGSGKSEHPTQALLDMYTLRRCKGRLDNLSVAIMGDLKYGRTSHSLITLLSLYEGQTIYGLSDEKLALPQEYIDEMTAKGVKYVKVSSFEELPEGLDAFYQTRVQYERIEGNERFKEFILNPEVMGRFPNALILHPLPRNEEIDCQLDDDARAVYFEQAKNGLYARMALLLDILGE